MHPDSSFVPTANEIATLAYLYYLDDGCPEGRSEEHWLRAETCLREQKSGNDAISSGPVDRVSKVKKSPVTKRSSATATKRADKDRNEPGNPSARATPFQKKKRPT